MNLSDNKKSSFRNFCSIFENLQQNFQVFESSIKVTVLGQSHGKKTLTFPDTLFEAIFYCNRKTL